MSNIASFVGAFEEGPGIRDVDGCVLTFASGCRYDPSKSTVLAFLEFLGEVRALADAVTFFLLTAGGFLALGMLTVNHYQC